MTGRFGDPKSPSWVLIETGVGAVFSLLSMLLISKTIGTAAAGTGAVAIAAFLLLDLAGSSLFTDAVVQRTALEPRHANSAATASVLVGAAAGVCLLLAAPWLAAAAGQPKLVRLLLVLAPLLPVSAYSGLVAGLVLRQHRYRLLAMRVLIGQPVALGLGLLVARDGGGPWAMVATQGGATLSVALMLLLLSRHAFRPHLDRRALGDLWPVAGPQILSVIVQAGCYRVFVIALGTITAETVVAVCNIGFRLLGSALSVVWGSVFRITLPRLAPLKENRAALAEAFGETAQLQALLGWPICAGVALTAPDMIQGLMGPAWSAAAGATRIVAVAAIISFAYGDASSLWIAIGKTRVNFYTSVISFVVPLAAVFLLRPQGPDAAAFCWAASSLVTAPLLCWLVLRELDRSVFWLLGYLAPAAAAVTAMVAVVLLVRPFLPVAPLASLVCQAAIGAMVFGAVAWVALGRRVPSALARPAAAL